MPDREKVIYDIERCICRVPDACRDCSHYQDDRLDCMEKLLADALALLKEQNGLMLALEQSNAVNGYLNAEVERLNGLLKEQEAKRKNRLPYSPDSNVQWT